jgi:hypothetical protein
MGSIALSCFFPDRPDKVPPAGTFSVLESLGALAFLNRRLTRSGRGVGMTALLPVGGFRPRILPGLD